ncbi:uncharacterized protein LOC144669468 isoform X1 [Cetorhinus maximus]
MRMKQNVTYKSQRLGEFQISDAGQSLEEAKSDSDGFVKVVDFDSLPLNYHDEENEEELVGDKIFHKYEKIDKETDDITGDTILSEREVIEEDDDDFPERRVIEPLHWQQ